MSSYCNISGACATAILWSIPRVLFHLVAKAGVSIAVYNGHRLILDWIEKLSITHMTNVPGILDQTFTPPKAQGCFNAPGEIYGISKGSLLWVVGPFFLLRKKTYVNFDISHGCRGCFFLLLRYTCNQQTELYSFCRRITKIKRFNCPLNSIQFCPAGGVSKGRGYLGTRVGLGQGTLGKLLKSPKSIPPGKQMAQLPCIGLSWPRKQIATFVGGWRLHHLLSLRCIIVATLWWN